MSSFRILEKQLKKIVKSLADFSGLDESVTENIVHYAACLPREGVTDIDEPIFTAQMLKYFNMSNANMISLIFDEIRQGTGNDARLVDFCKCICTFLTTDIDIRSDFVFRVYDRNGDGELTYLEIRKLVMGNVVAYDTGINESKEETLKDIVEIVIKIIGIDPNTTITAPDFRQIVQRNNICLDILGQVLPSTQVCQEFKNSLAFLSPMQVQRLFKYERFKCFGERLSHHRKYCQFFLELP